MKRQLSGGTSSTASQRITSPALRTPFLRRIAATPWQARRIDQMLQGLNEEEGATRADYDRLLVMHERESRALASIGVRLGIACVQNAKPINCVTNKPWEKLPR